MPTGQHIEGIVNPRQGVGILSGHIVQTTVVNAKTSTAVLFRNQDDQRRPRTITRLNLTTGQHISNTLLFFLHLLRRHPTRCATYGWPITGINVMFHCVSITGERGPRLGGVAVQGPDPDTSDPTGPEGDEGANR